MPTPFRKSLAAVALTICAAPGASHAAIITDLWNPQPDRVIGYTDSYSFTHALSPALFAPAVDILAAASLKILLRDNVSKGNELFAFEFRFGSELTQRSTFKNVANGEAGELFDVELNADTRNQLALSGMMDVSIRSLPDTKSNTGFIFAWSQLTAEIHAPPPVIVVTLPPTPDPTIDDSTPPIVASTPPPDLDTVSQTGPVGGTTLQLARVPEPSALALLGLGLAGLAVSGRLRPTRA